MITRAVVNVATGSYVRGQQRLQRDLACALDPAKDKMIFWTDEMPLYSPKHEDVPYAFKAWALKAAHCSNGMDVLLWCDSSIVLGKRPIKELWAKIEKDGYFIARNNFGQAYSNYEWTADSAYEDLFPDYHFDGGGPMNMPLARGRNKQIPHVCATTFGLDMRTSIGKAFLDEYLRLAQTDAFKGPWQNAASANFQDADPSVIGLCGPEDVRGHRHDQSAASVIAWRLGMELSEPPEWICYDGAETEETCLVAVGI